MRRRSAERHHECCCDRIGCSGGWSAVIGSQVLAGRWFVSGGCEALQLVGELVEALWLAEALSGLLWLVVQFDCAVTWTLFPSMQSGGIEAEARFALQMRLLTDLLIYTNNWSLYNYTADVRWFILTHILCKINISYQQIDVLFQKAEASLRSLPSVFNHFM